MFKKMMAGIIPILLLTSIQVRSATINISNHTGEQIMVQVKDEEKGYLRDSIKQGGQETFTGDRFTNLASWLYADPQNKETLNDIDVTNSANFYILKDAEDLRIGRK